LDPLLEPSLPLVTREGACYRPLTGPCPCTGAGEAPLGPVGPHQALVGPPLPLVTGAGAY